MVRYVWIFHPKLIVTLLESDFWSRLMTPVYNTCVTDLRPKTDSVCCQKKSDRSYLFIRLGTANNYANASATEKS